MRFLTMQLCALLIFGMAAVSAAETSWPFKKADVTALAMRFLRPKSWLLKQQEADGNFLPGDRFKLGITTVVARSLIDNGMAADDPRIIKASDFIRTFIQPDGGIYNPEEGLANYTTSLGMQVLIGAGKMSDAEKKAAQNYLFGIQNLDENSPGFGGIGYGQGGKGTEDLSNTSMAIEALVKSGVSPDHPGLKRPSNLSPARKTFHPITTSHGPVKTAAGCIPPIAPWPAAASVRKAAKSPKKEKAEGDTPTSSIAMVP